MKGVTDMELMTYKCPNCGGAIVFKSENQQFQCESCDSIFSEEQLKIYDDALKAKQAAEQTAEQPIAEASDESNYDWQQMPGEEQLEDVNTYSCKYCGAQIVTDLTTAASECPYCNNPIIMTGQIAGINRPDLIIPFKLDKNIAEEQLRNFYKRKPLLPKEFKTENRIKKISGIYVPFWLFDCNVAANISYTATRTRAWSDSKYNYTETSHFNIYRSGTLGFSRIPVDGSGKMDDAYMDAIEPFDYNSLVEFNPAYLSGYLADKYDVDANASIPRANLRIENSTAESFRSTVKGYSSVKTQGINIHATNGVCRYAMMPVWMLNTKYGDKVYSFAMNGQTGKLVGELPIDKKKSCLWLLGVFAAVMAVAQFFIF